MNVQQNVGGTDRVVRLVVGSILIVVGLAGYAGFVGLAIGPLSQALAAVLAVLIGLVFTVTGLARFCLLYPIFGVDTC